VSKDVEWPDESVIAARAKLIREHWPEEVLLRRGVTFSAGVENPDRTAIRVCHVTTRPAPHDEQQELFDSEYWQHAISGKEIP
jgi:hypothetical protein